MIDSQLPVLSCEGCGVCCYHMGFPTFNLTIEQLEVASADLNTKFPDLGPTGTADLTRWIEMPAELRSEIITAMKAASTKNQGDLDPPCIWLDPDSRLCKHHQHRPQVCRDFEIGSEECLDWREHYESEIAAN